MLPFHWPADPLFASRSVLLMEMTATDLAPDGSRWLCADPPGDTGLTSECHLLRTTSMLCASNLSHYGRDGREETQATWAAQMAFATIGLSVHGRLLGSRPRRAQRSCFCATATRAVPRAFAKRAASSEESCEQSECEYLQGEEARSRFAQTATEKLSNEVAKKRERESIHRQMLKWIVR